MDLAFGVDTLVLNTPLNNTRDNRTFTSGKHRGKAYIVVCRNNPEYFLWLVAQPAGTVVRYFDYIRFCLDIMTNTPLRFHDRMPITPG